jgi:N-methylhydantoinase A/oxoprolinase/acetone carboxylase beta subunit
MEAVTAEVNAHAEAAGQVAKSVDEVAVGFVRVANETMCRPIRALTQMKVGGQFGAMWWAWAYGVVAGERVEPREAGAVWLGVGLACSHHCSRLLIIALSVLLPVLLFCRATM